MPITEIKSDTPKPPEKGPTLSNGREIKARLNILEHCYYQPVDGETECISNQFGCFIESEEEPYRRTLRVGPEWQRIPLGDIGKIRALVLMNKEGLGLQVKPTKDEQEAIDSRIVEIGFHRIDETSVAIGKGYPIYIEPALYIPPREGQRIYPASGVGICARCLKGTVKVRIVAFPA